MPTIPLRWAAAVLRSSSAGSSSDSAMHAVPGRHCLLLAAALGLLAACGAGDHQAPGTADLVIEKAPANSGDRQVGVAGEPLEQDSGPA
jgi:hypothetical protein